MWNGRGVKRTRALGQNGTPLVVKWNGAILPRSILPHSAILLQHTMPHFAPGIIFEKKGIMSNIISPVARSNWCEILKKRHMIIFNHMQRFYYLISQNSWCQNASKFIYQNREIFIFCDILKTWTIASLISMYGAELADDKSGRENRPTEVYSPWSSWQ